MVLFTMCLRVCFVVVVVVNCQGPIYFMAKGRDHETMMALETHPQDIPWKIKLNPVWCKDIHGWALD